MFFVFLILLLLFFIFFFRYLLINLNTSRSLNDVAAVAVPVLIFTKCFNDQKTENVYSVVIEFYLSSFFICMYIIFRLFPFSRVNENPMILFRFSNRQPSKCNTYRKKENPSSDTNAEQKLLYKSSPPIHCTYG